MRVRLFRFTRALALAVIAFGPVPLVAQDASNTSAARWRLIAGAGAWSPRDAVIRAGGSGVDTRLGAGPSVAFDLQYAVRREVAWYGGVVAAFSTLQAGSRLQNDAAAPSGAVTILGGTAGLLVTVPGGFLGRIEPTLRLGGGMKGYRLDLAGASNQWRPTADIGLGLRGGAGSVLEVFTEARVLPSSFDQARLPTRGIAPQEQRQVDLMLTVGFTLRP